MAVRTVPDSVPVVEGPPPGVEALDAAIAALRARFPGAVIERYLDRVPTIGAEVFLAPGAVIVGDVTLGEAASVWYGCVLRGDIQRVVIGARTNVQDGTVVHLGDRDPAIVGEDVVIGHRAVIHGCTVEDAVLVGIGAVVLDGAHVGRGSVVGAGAVVTAGTVIPPHSLVLGVPAKVVRELGPDEEDYHRRLAGKYVRLQHNVRRG